MYQEIFGSRISRIYIGKKSVCAEYILEYTYHTNCHFQFRMFSLTRIFEFSGLATILCQVCQVRKL